MLVCLALPAIPELPTLQRHRQCYFFFFFFFFSCTCIQNDIHFIDREKILFESKIKKIRLFVCNLSIYIATYKTLVALIVCLFEAVRTNPGYGMSTLIYNFWDFWELFFVFARKLGWIFMHPNPYLRFWIFEIKYYNNIRANFLSYFNGIGYFVTIIHYLNK